MGWRGTRLRTPVIEQGSDYYDALRCEAEVKGLIDEISRLDPRDGCWEWVEEHHSEKWYSLLGEMKRIDVAFELQAAGDLTEAMATVRHLFHECVEAWGKNQI